jgi:hypothetical protein
MRGEGILTVFLIAADQEGTTCWGHAPEIAMGGIAERPIGTCIGGFQPTFYDAIHFVGL